MIQRCTQPQTHQYQNYGGRGIQVCERWLNFEHFLVDMGLRPEGRSIDRINNDGNYEPGNCRWATNAEQQSNKRNNRNLTFNGETHTLDEWARVSGVHRSTLRARLDRYGWNLEKALTAKLIRGRQRVA